MSPPPGFRLFGSEFPGLPVRRGLNYFGGHRDTWATERSQSIITIGSGALSRVEDQVIIPDQSIFSQTGDVSTPRMKKGPTLWLKTRFKLLEISRGTHLKFRGLKEDCIATQNVTLDKSFPCRKVSESLSHSDSEKQSFILPAVWGISISATPQRSFILPAVVWYICEGFPLLQRSWWGLRIPNISTCVATNTNANKNQTQKSWSALICSLTSGLLLLIFPRHVVHFS